MRSWNNLNDRRDATLLFVQALNQDAALRTACKNSSDTARQTFKTVGEFDDIPADVVFTVLEANSPVRDKLVTIILPQNQEVQGFESDDIMRCSKTRMDEM